MSRESGPFLPIESNDKEREKKKWREIFINKWTALLGAIAVALMIGREQGEQEKESGGGKDKGGVELKLSEADLPDNIEELKKGIVAAEFLHQQVDKRNARLSATPPIESPSTERDEEGEEKGKTSYFLEDIFKPAYETATDENFEKLNDLFARQLPDFGFERLNNSDYSVTLDDPSILEKTGTFRVEIRVEEDGSYTVYPPSNFGKYLSIASEKGLVEAIQHQLEVKKMEEKWAKGEITDEEFTAFAKEEMGKE